MSFKTNWHRTWILGLILSVFLSSGCVGEASKQSTEIETQSPQTTSAPIAPPPTMKPEYSTPEKTAETFWRAIEFQNYDYAFKALSSDTDNDWLKNWTVETSEMIEGEGGMIQYSDTVDVQISGGGYYATAVVYTYVIYGGFYIPLPFKTYFVKEADGWKISEWEPLEDSQTSTDTQGGSDEFLQNTSTSIGTRQNPASIGTNLSVKFEYLGDYYEANVTLLEVIRGVEAWKRIQKANSFNDPPREGFEYILAKIRFECIKGPEPDVIYEVSPNSFDVISSKGKEYENPSLVEPEPQLSARLYPGASHEGWAAFEVAVNDSQPVLTFGRDYQGRGGIWFKLYD